MTRKSAVLATLLFGGVVLLSAIPVWVQASTVSALGPQLAVEVEGSRAAPGVLAAGLAVLAAGIAGGLVGRFGRWIVIAVLLLASGIVLGSGVAVVLNPRTSALAAAAEKTGVAQLTADPTLTVWPWVALAIGVVGLLLCLALVRTSANWATASKRHERDAAATQAVTSADNRDVSEGLAQQEANPADFAEVWDAQTRGEQD